VTSFVMVFIRMDDANSTILTAVSPVPISQNLVTVQLRT